MSKTWIVVEDEPDLYNTLLTLFEIWSVDGVAFTNGTDAVKWIEDVDKGSIETNIPELAILDIRLNDPNGVTGIDVSHRLRQSPLMKNMAIVLITAYRLTPQEEKEVMARSEADALIFKPLPTPSEFRTTLQTIRDKRLREAPKEPAKETPPDKPTEPPKEEPATPPDSRDSDEKTE